MPRPPVQIDLPTAAETTGLLPAKWGGKARQMEEYSGPICTDGIPSLMALATKETVASGLDDGAFSNVWVRDQVNDQNYTIGAEFSSDTYPALGATQNYRVPALWYESGDGGLTRGTSEFARRFFVSGSRRFLRVGNWWYFPSLHATPARWDGNRADAESVASHLVPSGPLPPTHAGALEAGNLVGGDLAPQTIAPDGDVTVGAFHDRGSGTTNLYASIDESSPDDADWIQSNAGATTYYECSLTNFSVDPADDSTITVKYRARRATGTYYLGTGLRVHLVEGATIRASSPAINLLTTTSTNYAFTLTLAEVQSISDWTNLRLRFQVVNPTGGYYAQVSYAAVGYTPAEAVIEGAWKGSDRFLYAIAYRFEDGSVWMPCPPRVPNDDLPNGFNMFTVDATNPEGRFAFIRWKHIPRGPKGSVGKLLLRSLKVDSTTAGDELKLNPYDLRVVWELTDNSTDEYIDSQADDFGLAGDASGSFVRYDHLMPPRARYIEGGDMRIVHAYGGRNPCAIEIAPVGRAADYDLNLADDAAALYTERGSYMYVSYGPGIGPKLNLLQINAAGDSDAALELNLSTYDTLQRVVDRINATSVAIDGMQWRAQLVPGANPAAPSATCLTPHYRTIAGSFQYTLGSAIIENVAGGCSKVAVGALVTNSTYPASSWVPAGTYVLRVVSDTQLEMSANSTDTGTDAPTFSFDLGNDADFVAALAIPGIERVIGNSAPSFLYFNASYLNEDPIDKASVWMTVATPGSFKSAPNSFSGKNANRFKPPLYAGIVMGGGSVDQGFVIPYSGAWCALLNTRDTSSGIDEDYKLIVRNPHRGCNAWNGVVTGPGFVAFPTRDGYVAADLAGEVLITESLYQHGNSPSGSLAYELAQGTAATGQDSDGAYLNAKILRSSLWVNYRSSEAAVAHPDMQVVMDFSSGKGSGLAALFLAPGDPWGWSTRLLRGFSALCEGRRGDGGHLYGWNDSNQGGTGDGRIDEFEVGDTDNGVAFTGEVRTPWERFGRTDDISGQEFVLEHKAPAGSALHFEYHRSYENDVFPLTLQTTTLDVLPEVKMLPQRARVASAAVCMAYLQTSGAACELRKLTLRAKRVPAYR